MDVALIVMVLLGVLFVLRKCARKDSGCIAVGALALEQKSPGQTQTTGIQQSGSRSKKRKTRIKTAAAVVGTVAGGFTAAAALSAFRHSGISQPDDWMTDPAYCFMPGNIYYRDQFDNDSNDDDWFTNPIYSWMPGNIYHHDDSFDQTTASSGADDTWSLPSITDDPISNTWSNSDNDSFITTDDGSSSSGLSEDSGCTSASSDDDWSSSISSSSNDDDW